MSLHMIMPEQLWTNVESKVTQFQQELFRLQGLIAKNEKEKGALQKQLNDVEAKSKTIMEQLMKRMQESGQHQQKQVERELQEHQKRSKQELETIKKRIAEVESKSANLEGISIDLS
eukprot:GEZU01012785.1.p1 GENE.GEZU01012785.1~~GEZU01012785.1.p1  ORF type:complete len:117 (-),score=13.80 GEZU01012785.1:224-574(-)